MCAKMVFVHNQVTANQCPQHMSVLPALTGIALSAVFWSLLLSISLAVPLAARVARKSNGFPRGIKRRHFPKPGAGGILVGEDCRLEDYYVLPLSPIAAVVYSMQTMKQGVEQLLSTCT